MSNTLLLPWTIPHYAWQSNMWSREFNTSLDLHRSYSLAISPLVDRELLWACTCMIKASPNILRRHTTLGQSADKKWVISLSTNWNIECDQTPLSIESTDFFLSLDYSQDGLWPIACTMRWSIPKASYKASDGIARFLHWLTWLDKNYSHVVSTSAHRCLILDWSFRVEHWSGMENSLPYLRGLRDA
jgi:hypothetical protein